MIEDDKHGIKIATDEHEKMVIDSIEKIEKEIRQLSFSMELDEVILQYLKKKKGGKKE